MRALILTAMIVFANFTQVAAQTAPIAPPSTYPVSGTFCGFLTLCPKADASIDDI